MSRTALLLLLLNTTAHAQRGCVASSATLDVLRPCVAFWNGVCASYENVGAFSNGHSNGQIYLATWAQNARASYRVACFFPDGAAHPQTGYVRFLVDQTGAPALTWTPRDQALCGSVYDDDIEVAGDFDVLCGAGTLTPYVYGDHALELHGMSGDDVLFGGPGDDRMYGESGEDSLAGFHGDDLLSGGADHDQIIDYCETGDLFEGDGGPDTIEARFPIGISGGCTLMGGDGDDTLRYEDANPQGTTLSCGAGTDTLQWKVGVVGEWGGCPADCEIFASDPPGNDGYDNMCTP